MTDIIIVAVVLLIVGAATVYIVKAKKSGVKCIGCPSGATCGQNDNGGGCSGCGGGCHCHEE